MFKPKTCFIALAILSLNGAAQANAVTYDYVGNPFRYYEDIEHVGDRITASATFADGIANEVTSWKISNGAFTVNSFEPDIDAINDFKEFNMTFLNGDVATWFILGSRYVNPSQYYMSTSFSPPGIIFPSGAEYDYSAFFINAADIPHAIGDTNQRGTWTLRDDGVSAVPVPAALPLMASALGVFGIYRRKKLV